MALPKTSRWWEPQLFQPSSTALGGVRVQAAPLLPCVPGHPTAGTHPLQVSPHLSAIGGNLWLHLPKSSTRVLLKLRFVPTSTSFFSVWVAPAEKPPLFSYKNPSVSFSRVPKDFSVGLLFRSSFHHLLCPFVIEFSCQKAESRPRAFGSRPLPWRTQGFS